MWIASLLTPGIREVGEEIVPDPERRLLAGNAMPSNLNEVMQVELSGLVPYSSVPMGTSDLPFAEHNHYLAANQLGA